MFSEKANPRAAMILNFTASLTVWIFILEASATLTTPIFTTSSMIPITIKVARNPTSTLVVYTFSSIHLLTSSSGCRNHRYWIPIRGITVKVPSTKISIMVLAECCFLLRKTFSHITTGAIASAIAIAACHQITSSNIFFCFF